MPNLRDILSYAVPVGSQIAGGIANRRAIGGATNRLTTGVSRGMDALRTGTQQAQSTLDRTYAGQRETLRPFRETGERSLAQLGTGLEPGGGLADPFKWMPPDLENDQIFQRRLKEGTRLIEAKANAGGIRFSGATMKDFADYATGNANDYLSEDYNRAEKTFRDNQRDRYSRLFETSQGGQQAAESEVQAGSAYGANTASLQKALGEQMAELELEKANAEAEGDMAKAGTISDTISGVLDSVNKVGIAKTMASLMGGGGAAAAGTSLAALAGGAVPAIPLAATGAATAGTAGLSTLAATTPGFVGGTAGAAAGTAGAGGGAGATIGAFMTNPITVTAGIALGIGLLWRKSQARHEANQWVQGFQKPFDANMARIDQLTQAGSLTPEDAKALQGAAVADYMKAAQQFSKKGDDHSKVIGQSLATFKRFYGDPSNYGASFAG